MTPLRPHGASIGKSPAAALRAGRGGLGGGRLAPAWGAEVVSSNIVGYNKLTLQAGYNLLGNNWNLVGGGDGLITEVLDTKEVSGLDDEGLFTSQLQLWTGRGYTYYGWAGFVGDDPDSAPYNYKWLDQSTLEPVDIDAPKGTAFWIKTDSSADVVFSGEVATEDTISAQVSSGYNLLANPFPETISIQQIQSTNLSGLDDEGQFTSQLQLWTGRGYTYYGWAGFVGDDPDSAPYNYKWLDMSTLEPVTDVTLDIGKGFWIQTGSAADITFTK